MEIPEIVVTLIGTDTVGKTSIVNRLKHNEFQEHYLYTQGSDIVKIKNFKVGSSDVVNLTIYDTAGHYIQRDIIHRYIDAADAVMIVYDITNRNSFEKIPDWIEMATTEDFDNSYLTGKRTLMLVGNKTDLSARRNGGHSKVCQRVVKFEELEKKAKDLDISLYAETSAKTNKKESVNQAFKLLLENIIRHRGLAGKCRTDSTRSLFPFFGRMLS